MAGRSAPDLNPWGRFKLVSKDPAEESDHVYFYRTETRVGRNPQRAHVVIDKLFISGVHCIVKLEGTRENGDPIVKIEDLSRNGIYVNEVRVDKDAGAEIAPNATIHFTKPGLNVKNITPTVYRFEILRDGLTPDNAVLRAEHDASTTRLMPGLATPVSNRSNTSVLTTPASNQGTPAGVATTQLLTGKRQRRSDDAVMLEEMEVEVTRNVSTSGVEASPSSAKRRRTGDRPPPDVADADLVKASESLKNSNQVLRHKLAEAADREAVMKHSIAQHEREIDTLKEEKQAALETRKLAEDEARRKGEYLADREKEVERLTEEAIAFKQHVEELQRELEDARKLQAEQATKIGQLQAEHDKFEIDAAAMTSKIRDLQTKVQQSDEQAKAMYAEKKKLELALDSAQTRSEQVEEGKRGVHEEQMVLKTKITAMQKMLNKIQALAGQASSLGNDENSIISPELEALQRSDQSTLYSSEQSQPAPTQESFIGDTQPVDGDEEQTQDQEAMAARAGLVVGGEHVGPFASDQSKISLHQSVSIDLLDDHQQPISSLEFSVDETPGEHTEGKSSLESNVSSNTSGNTSSSSKTPPAPPLKRQKVSGPSFTRQEEAEETKGDGSDADADAEDEDDNDVEETAIQDEEEGENDIEETAIQDEEEGENDKENTPAAPDASEATSTKHKEKAPQPRWLQMVVNDDDKSEQVSASEGGGIFDDETQLSPGE